MLWCGANFASHASPLTIHAQCNKPCTRPWHKVIEYKVKKTSSSDSVPSRVIADLSMDILRKTCHQKLAPLGTRLWDTSALVKRVPIWFIVGSLQAYCCLSVKNPLGKTASHNRIIDIHIWFLMAEESSSALTSCRAAGSCEYPIPN